MSSTAVNYYKQSDSQEQKKKYDAETGGRDGRNILLNLVYAVFKV